MVADERGAFGSEVSRIFCFGWNVVADVYSGLAHNECIQFFSHRLAASLALREFALKVPTTFYAKTSAQRNSTSGGGSNSSTSSTTFLDNLYQAIRDPHPIVRAAAADVLSPALQIRVERQHPQLQHFQFRMHEKMMHDLVGNDTTTTTTGRQGNVPSIQAAQHGSLLVVSCCLAYMQDFLTPRYEEICGAVLSLQSSPFTLVRVEVIRLLPRLAQRNPSVFGTRYLEQSLALLIQTASSSAAAGATTSSQHGNATRKWKDDPMFSGMDLRPLAFVSLGQLVQTLVDTRSGKVIGGLDEPMLKITHDAEGGELVQMHPTGFIHERIGEIFQLVGDGLTRQGGEDVSGIARAAFQCAASLVEALGSLAVNYLPSLISDMFKSGLSHDLIACLHSVSKFAPEQRSDIENRILRTVSSTLARVGTSYHPVDSFDAFQKSLQSGRMNSATPVPINESDDDVTVDSLVLALNTLASFGNVQGTVATPSGAMIPLLPFLKDVVAQYLGHKSAAVRRSAAATCSSLLIPHGSKSPPRKLAFSDRVIDDVLRKMLRSALVDPVPKVRLAIIQELDARYDSYLRQGHHLEQLFLLLNDESFAMRSAGVTLLGRLGSWNPGSILPFMRHFLEDLVLQLKTVDNQKDQENAVRLLTVILRSTALHQLILPMLPVLMESLPMDQTAGLGLASASLEALGELAHASKASLRPWVHKAISHVLEVMEDRSSSSKLRTSLRTLGQIAGSTGYVIKLYIDFPNVLPQAIDILPASKRAPWSLRREVIRTIGIIGALDPIRYKEAVANTRTESRGGTAYFEMDYPYGNSVVPIGSPLSATTLSSVRNGIDFLLNLAEEEATPAHLYMYSQYSMVAQPVSISRPPKRLSPMHEDFYPMVAIQSLIGVLVDPALSVHHSMVVQAIMFIYKSMTLGAVPFLPLVVPNLVKTIKENGSNQFREFVLTQLAELTGIVREHMRQFMGEIFDLLDSLWATCHTPPIFSLVYTLGAGIPQDFRKYSSRVVRELLRTLEDSQDSAWLEDSNNVEKFRWTLRLVKSMRWAFGEFFHTLAPWLLKAATFLAGTAHDNTLELEDRLLVELTVSVLRTVSALLSSLGTAQYPRSAQRFGYPGIGTSNSSQSPSASRIIQPLVAILKESPPRCTGECSRLTEAISSNNVSSNCSFNCGVFQPVYGIVGTNPMGSIQRTCS